MFLCHLCQSFSLSEVLLDDQSLDVKLFYCRSCDSQTGGRPLPLSIKCPGCEEVNYIAPAYLVNNKNMWYCNSSSYHVQRAFSYYPGAKNKPEEAKKTVVEEQRGPFIDAWNNDTEKKRKYFFGG